MYNGGMTTLKICFDKQEWNNYVLEHHGHPLQLWEWGEVKANNGWAADRLFLRDNDDNIVGAAQILIRMLPWPLKSLAYVPRGPVTDESNREEMLNLLSNYVKTTHKSVALKIEPDCFDYKTPSGWVKSANYILPSRTISLDLNKPEDEILGDMENQTRRYIRKSAKSEVKIKRVTNREDLDKCLAIYHTTSKRAKFNLHSDQYYYDVFDKMKDFSPVFAAYVDDQLIAFLWLAISAEVAYEFYAGMSDAGRPLSVNHALKWYAIRKCKEWGLSRYDFGGLIEGGVEAFKMGWARQDTKLAGTFDKPLSIFYNVWEIALPKAKKITRRLKSIIKR